MYVAITRAKNRLWVVDYSDVCLPIKVRNLHTSLQLARYEYETQRYLLNLGLVVEPRSVRNPLESFINESTRDEWTEAGKRLLNHEEFEEAAMAFSKARNTYMHAVAMACHLREVARDIPKSSTRHRRDAFVSAASEFERCATTAEDDEVKRSHYITAARCYAEAHRHREVVSTLKLVKMYTEAASYCFDNNLLDEAVFLIKTFRVNQETTKRIKDTARMKYLVENNIE